MIVRVGHSVVSGWPVRWGCPCHPLTQGSVVTIRDVHPYIPNSAPASRAEMLAEIGLQTTDALYDAVPPRLRMDEALSLPAAVDAEQHLRRHMNSLFGSVTTTHDTLSFLGYGCYPHYAPAVCSEINSRAEFLTAYAGEPYEDHGKWQAIFEFSSLMAQLVEMDVVTVPTYDGYQAAATSLRMATRITNRRKVLVSAACHPAMVEKVTSYLDGAAEIVILPYGADGRTDLDSLRGLLDTDVAGALVQSPNVFGVVESELNTFATAAHDVNAIAICSTDPLSLGYLRSPAAYGIDIVCGDIQSLGLGMHFGGAHGGFVAVHDEPRFVFELPARLFGLAPTIEAGELGFTDVAYERTSLARREEGVEWVGTAAALWGITAAVYLASMGPQGMTELGTTVAAYTRYACERLNAIDGLDVLFQASPHWREVTVRYRDHSVAEVNQELLARGIFGGVDLSHDVLDLDRTSVFCFTELHDRGAIDALISALEEILA